MFIVLSQICFFVIILLLSMLGCTCNEVVIQTNHNSIPACLKSNLCSEKTTNLLEKLENDAETLLSERPENDAGIQSWEQSVTELNDETKVMDEYIERKVHCENELKIFSIFPSNSYQEDKLRIKVMGKCFVSQSEVIFLHIPLPTVYKSANELEFEIGLCNVSPGMYKIEVRNPGRILSTQALFQVKEMNQDLCHTSSCCKIFGKCGVANDSGNKSCVAKTEQDCLQSINCKTQNACKLEGILCIKP